MLERYFQADLIRELYDLFPGCIVLKNDANYIQGFPDLTVLYKNRYAVLECKASELAPRSLNQGWYIEEIRKQGGYASFIFPENKEEVLDELQQAFGA